MVKCLFAVLLFCCVACDICRQDYRYWGDIKCCTFCKDRGFLSDTRKIQSWQGEYKDSVICTCRNGETTKFHTIEVSPEK